MRHEILKILREADGKAISGELLAKKFHVSRTAIWKHIEVLRKQGYDIVSVVKNGYILRSTPNLLLPDEISNGLKTQIIGREIFYYETTDSTNEQAKKIITNRREKIEDGLLFVAEEQTSGKGRLERTFYSPKSEGILFSIVIRPEIAPQDAPKFTLSAAVAIAEAMEECQLKPEIKWPNDIVYKGKKIAGILTEMSAEIDKIHCIIIGCGINFSIKKFPAEIEKIATSIEKERQDLGISEKIDRITFFQKILEKFDEIYLEILESGFEKIFEKWRKYSITLGKTVRVIPSTDAEEGFEGKAIDIDSTGALIVQKSTGEKIPVLAGDVSIR